MPGVTIIIPGLDKKTVIRLQKVIENPAPVLKQIGVVLLGEAQKAFTDQQLGTIPWPQRYPRQQPPHINIAGTLADFLAGRKNPPERRFQNRPAGIDTNQTKRSLTVAKAITVAGYVLKVTSATPGAGHLQHGGNTVQPVTKSAKKMLGDWLKRLRKAVKKFGDQEVIVSERHKEKKKKGLFGGIFGSKTQSTKFKSKYRSTAVQHLEAASRLVFLFHVNVLKTRIAQRPFFGITDAGLVKIYEIITGKFLPPGIKGKKN